MTLRDSVCRAASASQRAITPLLGDATFHCQQAVEKALKAFLTWHDRPFRETHDLVELGAQCVAIDATLDPLLQRPWERIKRLRPARRW